MRQIGHFIDGELVAGTSGRTKDIYDPNTGRGAVSGYDGDSG